MFVVNLVFLALLASAQSGIPQYIQGQWVVTEENPQYEDVDGQIPAVKERMWPQSPSELVDPVKEETWLQSPPETVELETVEEQHLQTTPEPFAVKEQDNGGEASSVWKTVLVVAVLLVSIVGCLSMAYYMCVWRGGRIHYQPQKLDYA